MRGAGTARGWVLIGLSMLLAGVGGLGGAGPAGAKSSPTVAKAPAGPITFGPRVKVVQTNPGLHQALAPRPGVRFSSQAPRSGPVITVHNRTRYQHFRGAGGAMTDTSAWLIGTQLRPGTRAWLLRHLFGPTGINLNLIRVPMGASDFTSQRYAYSYDDQHHGQTDPTLSQFSIAHDLPYIIPVLRQAIALAERPFVQATPWSPPGWMKTNDAMGNWGNGGRLLPQAYAPLAQYFVRFLQAYARQGVSVAAITPQNEPGQQSTYPGMAWTAAQEAGFIATYLTPALSAAHLHPGIFADDGIWIGAARFGSTVLASPAAADLAGFATHCYYGSPTVMATLHQINPRLEQIESECAPGSLHFPVPELEIASLRNWATGIELWNLALDTHGGPVEAPNNGCHACRGIVTIDPATDNVTFGPDYYDLGQLSKFVRPGAVRIASNNFVSYAYPFVGADIASRGLDDVAFRNPDGSEVLVAYNGAAKAISFSVQEGHRYFAAKLPAGAMTTFTWKP